MTRLEALFASRAARIGVILAWLVLGGRGGEPSTLPLLAFIFLVALGVDYNIVGVHMPAAADTVAARAMADAGR